MENKTYTELTLDGLCAILREQQGYRDLDDNEILDRLFANFTSSALFPTWDIYHSLVFVRLYDEGAVPKLTEIASSPGYCAGYLFPLKNCRFVAIVILDGGEYKASREKAIPGVGAVGIIRRMFPGCTVAERYMFGTSMAGGYETDDQLIKREKSYRVLLEAMQAKSLKTEEP